MSSKSSKAPAASAASLLNRSALLRSASGVLLIIAGVFTLSSLLQINTGGVADAWASLLQRATGYFGALILALLMSASGAALLTKRLSSPANVIALEAAYFSFLALVHSLAFDTAPYDLVRSGSGGGALGWVFAEVLQRALRINGESIGGQMLSTTIWLFLFGITTFIAARPYLTGLAFSIPSQQARRNTQNSTAHSTTPIHGRQMNRPIDDETADESADGTFNKPAITHTRPLNIPPTESGTPLEIRSKARIIHEGREGVNTSAPQPTESRDTQKVAKKAWVPRPDTLPPLDLLKRIKVTQNGDADVRRQADIIETTLIHFALAGKVVEIRRGPAVTQFGVEPGYLEKPGLNGEVRRQKIRVGQIAALQNDFALALSASSIRIEAPIPGRSLVGIEVPNSTISAVDLRSLMESDEFGKINEKSPLAFGLGKDVSGRPVCADLGRMPHLLIAGTTGSGKSICISAITLSLVMNNRPEDLKLVMIDPKRVELSRFGGLPHIIGKPESEPERLPAVLKWAVMEMERRYKRFAEIGSRNIDEFNEAMKGRKEEPLPRIVILIDELADMMMQSPIETEKQICRLAQMARATGMHMVVATQRPSVDVVTGLIKANFPARMSFAVASSADSRVILDQVGAETLLGRGDMLFMNPESGQPQRIQGCFVSEPEIEQVIAWWKDTMQAEEEGQSKSNDGDGNDSDDDDGNDGDGDEYVANRKPKMETPWDMVVAEMAAERAQSEGSRSQGGGSGTSNDEDEEDDMIQKALEIIRTSGSVSASLLQRKLRIGYPRAARLMEDLQEMGYVGARSNQPTKPREVRTQEDKDND